MFSTCVHTTPIGPLALVESNGSLTLVWLPTEIPALLQQAPTALLEKACRQLDEYFSSTRKSFSLPLDTGGTPFQKAVWAALADIPYGQTRTYGEIARLIGRPSSARAVGGACNRNPLAVFIPCHRVVAATGAGGFRGGAEMKHALLALEQASNA